jgi:hypothetical protein
MPRSPTEGAATRGQGALSANPDQRAPVARNRPVRSGRERRVYNAGPPNGVERRSHERRQYDRRQRGRNDRRTASRRPHEERRDVLVSTYGLRRDHALRRQHAKANRKTSTKFLRALLITLVGLACLMAATLGGRISDAGAATHAAKAGVVVKQSAGFTASLSYRQSTTSGLKVYKQLRLTVKGPGYTTFKSVKLKGDASQAWGARPSLQLKDVTGDDTPDAIVTVFSGGAHCCEVSAIATSGETAWNGPLVRNWRDGGFKLKDLGGDSELPEFVAVDTRFIDAYSAHAVSTEPVAIYSLAGGKVLQDVTRKFPDYIQLDVTKQAERWQQAGPLKPSTTAHEAGRAAAASWAADLLLLGQTDKARSVIAAAAARGDFNLYLQDPALVPGSFAGILGHDLKAWGYVDDPSLIGLIDAP